MDDFANLINQLRLAAVVNPRDYAFLTEAADVITLLQKDATAPYIVANGEIMSVEPNIYDQEELHKNCTVQILKNSITGACSVGWWKNREAEE